MIRKKKKRIAGSEKIKNESSISLRKNKKKKAELPFHHKKIVEELKAKVH